MFKSIRYLVKPSLLQKKHISQKNKLKQKTDTEQYNLVFKKLNVLYPNVFDLRESKPLAIGYLRQSN